MKSMQYITRNYSFAFAKDFQHVLVFCNVFQKCCKWFLNYFKCIHARYKHFITHSQWRAQYYEQNKRRTTDTDYKYINGI